MSDPILFLPTRDQVNSLKVGDLALDCFGRWSTVVEITCRRDDIHGRRFVCFYTSFGPTSRISASMKEGELVRTVATTGRYRSVELDAIERRMLAERQTA